MHTNILPFIVAIPLLVFWLWMFWAMANNTELAPDAKMLWILGFVFLSLPTAIYYYFTQYRQHRI